MKRVQISLEDVEDKDRLRQRLDQSYQYLHTLLQRVEELESRINQSGGLTDGSTLSGRDRALLDQLAVGSTSNAAPAQNALIPSVSTLPPVSTAVDGQYVLLTTDGVKYRFDGATQTWSPDTVGSHNLLSATHPDTLAATVVRGDLVVGNSTPKWSRFAKGAALFHLRMNAGGTDPEWAAIADAELSANVPLLNASNAWSNSNTFNSQVTFNNHVRFSVFTFSGTQTLGAEVFVAPDTSGAAATAKLPAAPTAGDWYAIADEKNNAAANNITVDGNGKNINGSATQTISTNGESMRVFYTGSEWVMW